MDVSLGGYFNINIETFPVVCHHQSLSACFIALLSGMAHTSTVFTTNILHKQDLILLDPCEEKVDFKFPKCDVSYL